MRHREPLFGFKISALVLTVALVAGCGGGDDGSDAGSPQTESPPASGGGSSNAAPTIQGKPGSSVLAGQTYTFQPSASDADGDSLTFTAANLPAWADFNATTGRISGTPTAADIATYSNITITVSDGTATASLAPFSISVTDVGTGSATLSWVPPTQNSDGSSLTDLAGYRVLYGLDADNLNESVSLDNPSLSTYVLGNLTSGTWYFAVMAVNDSGVTSALSNLASKNVS